MRVKMKLIVSVVLVLSLLFASSGTSAYASNHSECGWEMKHDKEFSYDEEEEGKHKHSRVKLQSENETIRHENQNKLCYDFSIGFCGGI